MVGQRAFLPLKLVEILKNVLPNFGQGKREREVKGKQFSIILRIRSIEKYVPWILSHQKYITDTYLYLQ